MDSTPDGSQNSNFGPAQAEEMRARFASIIESSYDAIIGKTLDGTITSWNPAAETIFGYTADEMIGASMLVIIPPDRSSEETAILGRIARGERVQTFETVRRRKDGTLIDVSATISPIKDASGRIVGASKIVRDITARKKHAREIARMSRLYAALSAVNQAIVTTGNREELYEKTCRALVEDGGFRMAWVGWLDETTGAIMPVGRCGEHTDYLSRIVFHLNGGPEERGAVGIAIGEGRSHVSNDFVSDPCTALRREAAAHARFLSVAAFPVREGGKVRGAICVYADETGIFQDEEVALLEEAASDLSFAIDNFIKDEERRKTEAELRASEAKFRQVVENIREVFWMTDPGKTKMLYVSPAYETIWARTCESLYANPQAWNESIHEEDRSRVIEAALANQTSGVYDETYRIVRPDESVRWVHDQASPVRDPSGKITSIVGTAEDVTRYRKLEDQFRQAQKMEAIGTLAGGIAHDFNNILAAINGYTELAKMEADGSPKVTEYLAEVLRASQRAVLLVRQILAFSRQQELMRRPMQLEPVVDEALRLLRATIPVTIDFDITFAEDVPPVLADPTQVHQIVMNLATNASHAMAGRPGRLGIKLEDARIDADMAEAQPKLKAGRYALLSISDTGTGMDEATLGRIFEPFFTTKAPGEGTGLGLSAVHGIMQGHDGAVTVYSQPGEGTVFHLYFPAYEEESAPGPDATEPVRREGAGERILYVDDEMPLALLGEKILGRLGYVVERFTKPLDALAAVKAAPSAYDLVITDQMMPKLMGTDLAAEIHALRPDLPIILMTGHTSTLTPERLRPLGIGELVLKPLSIDGLGEVVQRMLARSKKG